MLSRTFTATETSVPGFKVAKDKQTLLFRANADGNFKLKPVLIYHSENIRILKNYSNSACALYMEHDLEDSMVY